MRPVTKGIPTTAFSTYPFYTVPSLNANLHFNANNAVSRGYSGNTYTGWDISVLQAQTDLLTVVLGGNPFNPATAPAQQTAAATGLKNRLADLYRQANPYLSAQIGAYCSFCEISMPGHQLDVEHRVPKAPYPTETVWWWNFLQCCGRCNPIKGNRPTRATAIGWAGPGANEPLIVTTIINHYFWPDINADSYRRVLYRLKDVPTYALIGLPQSVNLQNQLVGFFQYEARANVQLLPGNPLTLNRRIEVTAEPAAVNVMNTETLALMGVSTRDTARAGYRTRTWFSVLNALSQLSNALAPYVGNNVLLTALFNLFWGLFLNAAQSFGHYSTIVTVLAQFAFPPFLANPNGYVSLANLFVHDTDPANANIFTVYAGTNTAQVP